jgi:hypothetical protein
MTKAGARGRSWRAATLRWWRSTYTLARPCTARPQPRRALLTKADARRDAEKRRLLAKAVAEVVRLINGKVLEALVGMDPQIDQAIMDLDKAQHKVHHPYPQPFLFSTSVVNRILHCEALCGNNFSSAYHVS